MNLKHALGDRIPHPFENEILLYEENTTVIVPSDDIEWSRVVLTSQLKEEREEIFISLTEEVSWSLNIMYMTRERLEKLLASM